MVFSSLVFLFVFLPLFLFSYFVFKKRKIRNIILLIFSLFFYGYGEPIYVLLMIFSIIINYLLALLMMKKNKKLWLWVAIIFNLGLLGFFKYTDFFISNINNLFNINVNLLKISLPIGISFYTFQILTYVIDVYKKKNEPQKSIIALGCYISSFPQLIAGPIVNYDTVNEELENRKESLKDFYSGLKKFIIGLAKKVIIANEMAYVADHLLGYNGTITFVAVVVGVVAYTLQIYYDFSGYSDMAIGLGRMIGFHYLENFNYPYIATSITDFWRSWHISLSSFFKEYVYIPLGGNRTTIFKNIRNILIVWILTGLWHGASWNFIIWGLYYGILLIIEKFILKKCLTKLPSWLKHTSTIILIIIGWLIFYYTDLTALMNAFKSLFMINGFFNKTIFIHLQIIKFRTIIIFILGIIFCIPFKLFNKDSIVNDILLIILLVISIMFIVTSSYNPFIYFRF